MALFDMTDYNTANESTNTGGSIEEMPAGAYVLTIQKINLDWENRNGHQNYKDRRCVQVVYDVAEGQFAGRYSEDFFDDPSKDSWHCCYLSWKSLGWLKRLCGIIDRANPGFDSAMAINAEKWSLLIGKKFGAVIDGKLTTNARGYDKWLLNFGDWCDVDDVRSGNTREPEVTDVRESQQTQTFTTSTTSYTEDIPF